MFLINAVSCYQYENDNNWPSKTGNPSGPGRGNNPPKK